MKADIDTYLLLMDSTCTVVASDDDGGDVRNSRMVYTAPLTGVYTVIATTYSAAVTGKNEVTTTPLNEF